MDVYNVFFSQRAIERLDELTEYLADHWSQQVKTNFLVLLAEKVALIGQMPYMYRASATMPGCRECVVNRLTVLYYRVDENTHSVEIITVQSARSGGIDE